MTRKKLIDYTVERSHRHAMTKQSSTQRVTDTTLMKPSSSCSIKSSSPSRSITIPAFHYLEKIPYGSLQKQLQDDCDDDPPNDDDNIAIMFKKLSYQPE
eukprot:CAMPEP_0194202258 /NCGR_PEP_ID=MMETSP0156-20130528/2334_1 /TAXON_ID=33649 /ORGANISM="Thalassionema nitzschioides, Strain L26-B" /LENGTH=98 /DNA_ID=CAMNT_0038927703 /DNA_START=106 /DNA_END=403 /DNA_ORIENTATION=-